MRNVSKTAALRGATTVDVDTKDALDQAILELFETLSQENRIEEKDILYIMFTQTSDLKSRNPAAALRASGYATDIPLFCSQEPEINGMMEKVLRILIVFKTSIGTLKPVYLRRACNLRPDFAN
ncbi:MAG: chorismate mutase [Spirochaetaceae bacterium]|nr:chorismate mutase [Spirochaetaceae bacterium]